MDIGLGLPQPARAYGYVRVSTAEQAEHKTSVKQQQADIEGYCRKHGIDLIKVFVEPGLSGSDWSRPEFNRMLLLATGDDHPVDCIIACDMARLARDVEFTVTTQGQLQRANVRSLFVYQKFEDSHVGLLHKLLTSWQDQDAIVKASMNTRRGLRGTAEEGFWIGGTVPLGYESRTVEIRSKKEKKKLFVKDDEAALVRLIFDLAERGLNGEPMGGRAIADYLNSNGYTRRGKPFYNATLAKILSHPHYLGRFPGNKHDVHGNLLPEDQWTWVDCPQIIEREQFERVAALRSVRAPRNTPPRITSGPTLLVGIAKCGIEGCGCGMTIATGKSGQYKYYKCHAKTNRGAKSCSCPNVRADKLDPLVMQAVADEIFAQDRLEPLLRRVLDTSDAARNRRKQELEQCEAQHKQTKSRLANLYDAIEVGTMSARDPDIADRIKRLRTEIDGLNVKIKSLRTQLEQGRGRITPQTVEKFGRIVREKLISGDGDARRQIARAFIKEIRIGEKITIKGETEALEHAAASLAGSKGKVPIFDRKWCGREDSNFHGLSPTTTSTLRVYQFRHDRTQPERATGALGG